MPLDKIRQCRAGVPSKTSESSILVKTPLQQGGLVEVVTSLIRIVHKSSLVNKIMSKSCVVRHCQGQTVMGCGVCVVCIVEIT
jgi:hypothetical protein